MGHSYPRATAQIGGHPIHPMLIPFPIAFLAAVFVCDVMFWFTGGSGWATAATWLLGAGIATALLAALAGFTDFLANGEVRAITAAWQHMIGNLTAVFLVLINFLLRLGGGAEAVLPWGLLISTAVVLILLYTGWKGGHLVYQHRVGVNPPSEETH